MEALNSRFDEKENRWVVSVVGEIDIYNANDLKDALLSLVKEKEADLFIDCVELSFIDSTGLGSLVTVLKTVKLFGGEVILANVKKAIAKLFRITNLDKAFVITANTDVITEGA